MAHMYNMYYSLNSLMAGYTKDYTGEYYRAIKGERKSLDYSSSGFINLRNLSEAILFTTDPKPHAQNVKGKIIYLIQQKPATPTFGLFPGTHLVG